MKCSKCRAEAKSLKYHNYSLLCKDCYDKETKSEWQKKAERLEKELKKLKDKK